MEAAPPAAKQGQEAREYWVKTAVRVAEPVLKALSENRLKATMPVEEARREVSHLEALGRTLAGIAPWLELGGDDTPEGIKRGRLLGQAIRGISNAVDPGAADCLNFSKGHQPLVDAAFLAHALHRAPLQLWGGFDDITRTRLLDAFRQTRPVRPPDCNWLLFTATVETALWRFGGEGDVDRIEYAVGRHLEWYKGDGVYGDGLPFHWDYYNSFVIQPMLLDVVAFLRDAGRPLGEHYPLLLTRARRYAAVQEQLISPEGTFPILGRSSTYRFGAFQLLAQIALMHELSTQTPPGAVRAGLTEIIRRSVEAPGTFDEGGWLRIGVAGFQPSLREAYISTGSLYLCLTGMLALGLPANDPFWTVPDAAWTQKRIWAGEDVVADHSIKE